MIFIMNKNQPNGLIVVITVTLLYTTAVFAWEYRDEISRAQKTSLVLQTPLKDTSQAN